MPNLVGIGLSQVPTNSMLGGMAYQDPDRVKIKKLHFDEISQINSEIANTAVDVFIYDTSKDSDGGAWRKRTQHTSWYNETLGTATRGTRREFPAVAVIVAEATQLTIYDGDDPDLPMWMVFNLSGAVGAVCNMLPRGGSGSESDITSVAFLNAKLVVGLKDVSGNVGEGPVEVNFISDFGRVYRETGSSYTGAIYKLPISGRNSNSAYNGDYDSLGIVAQTINDVAMTVLPNAPIDDATGLPVPTIAVGTNGGASIIKDDGSVVDIVGSSQTVGVDKEIDRVYFVDNQYIAYSHKYATELNRIPSSDDTAAYYNQTSGWIGRISNSTSHWGSGNQPSAIGDDIESIQLEDEKSAASFSSSGLSLQSSSKLVYSYSNTDSDRSSCYITKDYNTGWQVGAIKGAFLSDTDTTNAVAAYYDDFANNNNNWGFVNASISSGNLVITQQGSARATDGDALSHVSTGVKLVFTGTVSGSGTGTFVIDDDGAGAGQGGTTTYGSVSSTGSFTFTATKTGSPRIRVMRTTGSNDYNINFLNISTEYDRSVNNKGLGVYGTVTKSAVATGAELVAYGPFTDSNYLRQPYNSDMNFGTGAFSVCLWIKPDTNTPYMRIINRVTDVNNHRWELYTDNGQNNIVFYTRSGGAASYLSISGDAIPLDIWTHVFVVRESSGDLKMYLNGQLKGTSRIGSGANASIRDLTSTTANLLIGNAVDWDTGNPFDGQLALVRISGSAPSAEQIKKIYEDEKVLFQENAKATLYGSSDAVTALAYDEVTDQLHVGTSSGRSDFQGLRRINNTTTAVTTAISTHDEFIIEQ